MQPIMDDNTTLAIFVLWSIWRGIFLAFTILDEVKKKDHITHHPFICVSSFTEVYLLSNII